MSRIYVATSNAGIAGEFVMFLFNVRTMAHILHLNTRSHAQHEALDSFYKELVDKIDRFAESAYVHYSGIQWPSALGEGLVAVNDLDPISYLRIVKSGVDKALGLIQEEDLRNIMAEILELTTSTLYKLERLS